MGIRPGIMGSSRTAFVIVNILPRFDLYWQLKILGMHNLKSVPLQNLQPLTSMAFPDKNNIAPKRYSMSNTRRHLHKE